VGSFGFLTPSPLSVKSGQPQNDSHANQSFEDAQRQLRRSNKQVALNLRMTASSNARVVLYSLNPYDPKGYATNTKTFHGFRVLGKTEVTSAGDRATLIDSLVKGIQRSDGRTIYCFKPRHGLRLITGSIQSDLVICFECHKIEAYDFNSDREIAVTAEPTRTFNSLLERYHLPRSKD
jgi:hypothetical protein